MIRHFLNTNDLSRGEIDQLLQQAGAFKQSRLGTQMAGRTIALVFFNPSMRTRSSFEIGAWQLGGHAVVLQPGKDAWGIEFNPGQVMDGDPEEHVSEVARVLSRYCDLIAVRAFPKFVDWQIDREDRVLRAFAEYATVPVINLETITHPCQELAHAMMLKEQLGELRGKKYVLTWTYHPKPLNTAVANSALLIATRMGLDVTLLCPMPIIFWIRAICSLAPTMQPRAGAVCRSRTISTPLIAAPMSYTPRAGVPCHILVPGRASVLCARLPVTSWSTSARWR